MVFPVFDPFENEDQQALRKACVKSLQVIFKHRKTFLETSAERDAFAGMSPEDRRTQFGVIAMLGNVMSMQSRLPSADPAEFAQDYTPYQARTAEDPLAEIMSTWPGFDLESYTNNWEQPEAFVAEFGQDFPAAREIGFEFLKIRQATAALEVKDPGAGQSIMDSFQQSVFVGIDPSAMYQRVRSTHDEARMKAHDNENEPVM